MDGWEFWLGARVIGRAEAIDPCFMDELRRLAKDSQALSGILPPAAHDRLMQELSDIEKAIAGYAITGCESGDDILAYQILSEFMRDWRGQESFTSSP